MKTLEWPNIWEDLKLKRDSGSRWFPSDDTPEIVAKYCYQYRAPSRRFPQSYAKPLLTRKFAKYLLENDNALATSLGLEL